MYFIFVYKNRRPKTVEIILKSWRVRENDVGGESN
jgi:hypothetical protein